MGAARRRHARVLHEHRGELVSSRRGCRKAERSACAADPRPQNGGGSFWPSSWRRVAKDSIHARARVCVSHTIKPCDTHKKACSRTLVRAFRFVFRAQYFTRSSASLGSCGSDPSDPRRGPRRASRHCVADSRHTCGTRGPRGDGGVGRACSSSSALTTSQSRAPCRRIAGRRAPLCIDVSRYHSCPPGAFTERLHR